MRESRFLFLKRTLALILAGAIFGFAGSLFDVARGSVNLPAGAIPPNDSGSLKRSGSNLGVGFLYSDPNPLSTLSVKGGVKGGMSVGAGFQGSFVASGTLAVQGSVYVGATGGISKFSLSGGGVTINDIPQVLLSNERVPRPNNLVSIPIDRLSDNFASIVGVDGNPFLVYLKHNTAGTTLTLEVIHCLVNNCTSREGPFVLRTYSALSNVDGDGWTSVAIGTDGFPVVAFGNEIASGGSTDFRLSIAKCNDVRCSGASVTEIVDASSDYGKVNRIVIGTDGFPVIAYFDVGNIVDAKLKIAKCNAADCSMPPTITTISSLLGSSNVASLDIDIGPDGLPFVVYTKGNDAYAVHCKDVSCVTFDNPVKIVPSPQSGSIFRVEMARGEDGLPLIAYKTTSVTSTKLSVAKCTNIRCDSGNNPSGLIYSNNVPYDIEEFNIDIGPRGYPILLFNLLNVPSQVNGDMYFVGCADHACSQSLRYLVEAGSGSNYPVVQTLLFGSDGLPMLMYTYVTSGGSYVRFKKCGSETCIPYWTRK